MAHFNTGARTVSACRLSFLTMMIAPLRMANREPSSLGTFSVSGEGKGIVSPTLTGRASARYDRAVRELIAIRAGLGAKGAPRVALLKEPAVPGIGKSKQRSAALTPKRGREGRPYEL